MASNDPTIGSGQRDSASHTAPAAISTARFEIMSLREHSQTELMLTSSVRCFHKSARQVSFRGQRKQADEAHGLEHGSAGMRHTEGHLSDDLRNFMDNARVATLFLDPEMRIRRFTRAASWLFHLLPSDEGRPLRGIAS
jgi:hypothetical protein